MEFIKLFEKHSEYETYLDSEDYKEPNLCYCEDIDDVHFNKYEKYFTVVYDITSLPENGTKVNDASINLKTMIVDGVVLDTPVQNYNFTTLGEHTILYEVNDLYPTLPSIYLNNIDTVIKIIVPTSCKVLTEQAFNSCEKLLSVGERGSGASVELPKNLTEIPAYIFGQCGNITTVTLPNKITTIGQSAFSYNNSLTDIYLGENITSIGQYAFESSRALKNITIKSVTPPTIASNTFIYISSIENIYVPAESVDAYKSAQYWSNFSSQIKAIGS